MLHERSSQCLGIRNTWRPNSRWQQLQPPEMTAFSLRWRGHNGNWLVAKRVETALDPEQEDLRMSPKFSSLVAYHIVIKSQPPWIRSITYKMQYLPCSLYRTVMRTKLDRVGESFWTMCFTLEIRYNGLLLVLKCFCLVVKELLFVYLSYIHV